MPKKKKSRIQQLEPRQQQTHTHKQQTHQTNQDIYIYNSNHTQHTQTQHKNKQK